MRPRSFRAASRIAAVVLAGASLACLGSAALGQAAPPTPENPATIVAAERVALTEMLKSPKDAGFARAIGMLPGRIRELRTQVPDLAEIPEPMIELALAAITSPVRVTVTDQGVDPNTGQPGIGAVISFGMRDEQTARRIHGSLSAFLAEASGGEFQSQASARFDGMSETVLPVGALAFGPRKGADGAWRYEAIVGAVADPDRGASALVRPPEGAAVLARARLDLAAAAPFTGMLSMMMTMSGAPGSAAVQQLAALGVLGPEALAFDVAAGHEGDALVARAWFRGMKKYANAWGIPEQGITESDLAIIPPDATYALIAKRDWGHLWQRVETGARSTPQGREVLAQFAEATGVDLRSDVFEALGDTQAVYLSDATGGGSFMSLVVAGSVKDRARLGGALSKLANMVSAMTSHASPDEPRVTVSQWSASGVEYLALRTPGFPLPVDITFALTDRWMIAGLTPQAVASAVSQAQSGGSRGLLGHPRFAKHYTDPGKPMTRLSFLDTERALRGGYGWLSLVGMALSNAVRSPEDPSAREPGSIVPAYHELAEGVRPIVTMAYFDGDDLVWTGAGDGSMTVNLGAALGVIMPIVGVVAPIAAIAEKEGREHAEHHDHDEDEMFAPMRLDEEVERVQAIADAVLEWAADHESRTPPSVDALVEDGYLDPDLLESALGEPGDGGPHFVIMQDVDMEDLEGEELGLLVYSRSSVSKGDVVVVATWDGWTDILDHEDFAELVGRSRNSADWMVPERPADEDAPRPRTNYSIEPAPPARSAV